MRFSYNLIKELVPQAESQGKVMDALTMHAFPAEDPKGATFDVELPSNRYADLASHVGVAREYATVAGKKFKEPDSKSSLSTKGKGQLKVKVEDAKDCPRYAACLFEAKGKAKTPLWMAKILKDCGLRLVNPVVDILNYVMLETGQPMHAFDADKLEFPVTVRKAKQGERITTIDGQELTLTKKDLVVADAKGAQAIAGIKGSKSTEVTGKTKKILVEAANFEQVLIYSTSKTLKLTTDASARFAHGMSLHSVEIGMDRAYHLLEQIVKAKLVGSLDLYPNRQSTHLIGFDVDRFNSLVGLNLKKTEILKSLKVLGFEKEERKSIDKADDFIVKVPPLRLDIDSFEDLAEEVVRLYGIDKLEVAPPSISLRASTEEDITIFKDRIRNTLTNLGISEVYTSSFVDRGSSTAYEVENPLATHKTHLRQDLGYNLKEVLKENSKNFKTIKVFELGNVFDRKIGEQTHLAIALKGTKDEVFLELKGSVEQLLTGLGFTDFNLYSEKGELVVEVNGEKIGEIKHLQKDAALAEFDASRLMELEEGEFEYTPLSRYPSVMRDVSLTLKKRVPVGEILAAIEDADAKHVQDVDLIDYYDPLHLTFRIVFQSQDRTLKDSEVNKEFKKIVDYLKRKFFVGIR